jgi:hypothetical protein
MSLSLDTTEVRVLGSLIEKDLTTPDYYPLTAGALTAACNQRSNRDPVMSLSEAEVLDAVESLTQKYLVWERGGAGGRVPRYAHKLSGTLTRAYEFSREELAVLAVLLLRGPQTSGEIRARAPRTVEFQSLEAVEATLRGLAEAPKGPFVVELPREAGRRERRFAHLFGGTPLPVPGHPEDGSGPAAAGADLESRVRALEERLAILEAELEGLRAGQKH